jgi:predicted lipoprotein with Yx(FWY)xxD motif
MSTVTIKGHEYLGTQVVVGGGIAVFPVYTYSGGTTCTGECAVKFPPLYAQGTPGLIPGLAQKAGIVTRTDGSLQRTWHGKPLYLFGNEGVGVGPSGPSVLGNGNGVQESGGTFKLVSA